MITVKLAISYMKRQKGKTIALLASVALAVMLIFSMNVIRDSGYNSQIKEAKDLHGSYDLYFENLDINSVETLKEQKEVKKSSNVKYFCEMVDKDNGVTLDLNTFNKNHIDSLNYKMVGREPIKDGEIVIEDKATEQMGIKDPLNKDIDLMLLNKYFDEKKVPQIDSANKTFKIVGLVEKPDKYYKSINGFKAQAFIYKETKLPITKTEDTYKGTLYLRSEKDKSEFVTKMRKKLDMDYNNLDENVEVLQAENLKMGMKYSTSNIGNSILLIIVSSLVIYNIFNIILADMTNQIGMMRAIGMSNKKIKRMFKISNLIYIIVGTLIGIIAGIVFSYIGVRIVYGYSSILSIERPSIIYSFLVSIIAVSFASFIVVRKSLKMSIIDSISNSDKYERKSKKNHTKGEKSHGNILMKFVNRNIWRNKSRTLLTIIAMSLVGIMFIYRSASISLIKNNIDSMGGIGPRSYGNIDITLSGDYQNTEDIFYRLNGSLIQKVKKEKGVKKVEPNFYNQDSYLSIDKEKVSSDYIDELRRRNSNYNNEYPLLVRGYDDNLLKNIDSFINKGENIINSELGEYKKIILVNNFYSRVKNSFLTNVMDNVKVGDILEIKLPVYENGLEKYETFKVQVSGIMDNTYIATQDGDPQFNGGQVIFKEADYKELTGQENHNKLFVMVENGELDSVEKELEKIVKNYSFTSIGGKNEDNKYIGGLRSSEDKLNVIYQSLIILILSVNIIFIVRSNIITRTKELSILRAIGMSTKDVKKIILIESEMYGIISVILSAIVGTIYYNKGISKMNSINIEAGYTKTVGYNIPLIQILIVVVISIVVCLISVYVSKDKIEGINITEGIAENG